MFKKTKFTSSLSIKARIAVLKCLTVGQFLHFLSLRFDKIRFCATLK